MHYSTTKSALSSVPLVLYNTRTDHLDTFTTSAPYVRMYNCGPTVYDTQHMGNLSMFVFTDILRRTLEYNGFDVKQVINITDVGHLSSDADDGEDKMTKGLIREGKALTLENMRGLAETYAQRFTDDLNALNIDTARISFPRASDHIPGQLAIIQTLFEKGYVYKTKDGLYFDTARFPTYGSLGKVKMDAQKSSARVDANTEKHSPADFALWKFNESLGWDAPWGKGFPGWHIECSAMARSELGEQIDIHTGGIEHIPIHHNNEIAQSEAATGKHPFARFWMHRAHLHLNGKKVAKSDGNVIYLSEMNGHELSPLAFRYWLLTSHYRTQANITWDALTASQTALERLRVFARTDGGTVLPEWQRKFHTAINHDLDTPTALAALWEMTKSSAPKEDIAATLRDADRVFGLSLAPKEKIAIPDTVTALIDARKAARDAKDWKKSDELRDQILAHGFFVKDTPTGQEVTPQ